MTDFDESYSRIFTCNDTPYRRHYFSCSYITRFARRPFFRLQGSELLTNAVKTQSNYLAFITIINQTVIQIRMSMLCPFSRSLCLSTCTHKTFISRLIKILKSRYRPPEMQLQPKRDFAYKSRVNAVC